MCIFNMSGLRIQAVGPHDLLDIHENAIKVGILSNSIDRFLAVGVGDHLMAVHLQSSFKNLTIDIVVLW